MRGDGAGAVAVIGSCRVAACRRPAVRHVAVEVAGVLVAGGVCERCAQVTEAAAFLVGMGACA